MSPASDVINAIALNRCTDTRRHLYFRTTSGVRAMTLADLDRQAMNVAHHLHALGVRPRDRVGIMGSNRIEWVLLDLAVLKVGAVTAGVEPGRFQPSQLVTDYGLRLLFAEGTSSQGAVHDIETVGAWREDEGQVRDSGPFHTGYDPADICAIKFTSGSTGSPKGLEATVASVNGSLASVQEMFAHGDGDNILIFLQLRLLQQRYWIYSALVNQHDVTLVENMDGVLPMAQATSPTVIMGVPGFYEYLKGKLEATDPSLEAAVRRDTIQAQLGGRIRYLWTGSAPAGRAVLEFFNDAGVPLYEGYGLNETCIVAKNHPGAFHLGSVGQVLPTKSVRVDKDGILIVGSRYPVNCRYTWCAPGANEKTFLPTAEVRTFDLGHIDEQGFLYVDGRTDDVLALSTGRNVLTTLVEEQVREHPDVHDCVLFGAGRPFLSAVVSPGTPDLDEASLTRHVQSVNTGLFPEQRVHALVVASEPFSMDNGLLTSQFKPIRHEIHRRYAEDLAVIYDEDRARGSGAYAASPISVIAGKNRVRTKQSSAV